MNTTQRNQANHQSDNGGNEKPVSSSRSGAVNKEQPALSTDDPAAPRGSSMAADQNMDDDTGLSNRANRQPAAVETGNQQAKQSNVGRRDDGTPD
jgi:hypothetical protein